MQVNFIGNFDEAFFFLFNNGYRVNNYIYQTDRQSNTILLICQKAGIPCVEVQNAKDFTRDNFANLFDKGIINVVASFGVIIPSDVIKNYVFINVHPGILPHYRGRHPLPQAIINHENYMGVTVHVINSEGIDTGRILAIEQTKINYSENYRYNELKLRGLIQGALYKALGNYFANRDLGNVVDGDYYKPLERKILERIFSVCRLTDLWEE